MKFYCIKNLEKFEISQLLSSKSLHNYDKKLKKKQRIIKLSHIRLLPIIII